MIYSTICRLAVCLFLLSLIVPDVASSQKLYNRWYFGQRAGLNFNTTPPSPLTDSRMDQLEGSSVICDNQTGDLLFYTDGETVWDARQQVMQNGTDLMGHWTSAQSAIIVPKPGDANIYYIFTAGAGLYHTANDNNNGFRYSIVDMRLNGGNGAVTEKNVELLGRQRAVEVVNATHHCNGVDYWVIGHGLGNNNFYVYKLSAAGVDAPIMTSIGSVLSGSNGSQSMAKFSPDGSMVALTTPSDRRLELFDFDNATGVLSNYRDLGDDEEYYGPEFSPDNTKLYTGTLAMGSNPNFVFQFDLSGGSAVAIKSTKVQLTRVGGSWQGAQCQLGPNGKIFVSFLGLNTLSLINEPNKAGLACGYQANVVNLGGRSTNYGMPNLINSALPGVVRGASGGLDVSVEFADATTKPNGTSTAYIIVCNPSSTDVTDVKLDVAFDSRLTPMGLCTPQVVISSVLAGTCDTFAVEVKVSGSTPDSALLSACVALRDFTPLTCFVSDSSCASILSIIPEPADLGPVDYTFHFVSQCPGTTLKDSVLFHSRRYTDTIVQIAFSGPNAADFRYRGSMPISIPIRPTTDQWIPITISRRNAGEVIATMYLITTLGDTFRIGLKTRGSDVVLPSIDVGDIRLGNRTGTFDTCVTITNSALQGMRVVDTAWYRGGGGSAELISPTLPFMIKSGVPITLCFRSNDLELGMSDTVILAGLEDIDDCPHCMTHPIIINTRLPLVSGAPTPGDTEEGTRMEVRLTPTSERGTASLRLGRHTYATLELYNMAGERIGVIAEGYFARGEHAVVVDVSELAAGGYILRFNESDRSVTDRLFIVR